MVLSHGFEFKLVKAETKQPFREVTRDDGTYVEVEPEVEFFISAQKLSKNDNHDALKVRISVDGKSLGYGITWFGDCIQIMPKLYGIRSVVQCSSTHQALVFKNSQSSIGDVSENTEMRLGKIELKIIEGTYGGTRERQDHRAMDFDASAVEETEHVRSAGENYFCSEVGSSTCIRQKKRSHLNFHDGAHLATVALEYCVAPESTVVNLVPNLPTSNIRSPSGLEADIKLKVNQADKEELSSLQALKRPASSDPKADIESKKNRSGKELPTLQELTATVSSGADIEPKQSRTSKVDLEHESKRPASSDLEKYVKPKKNRARKEEVDSIVDLTSDTELDKNGGGSASQLDSVVDLTLDSSD